MWSDGSTVPVSSESCRLTLSFDSLGLAEPLMRALADQGYSAPTPIQSQAIPPLLEGRDLVGIAQTGTGKTASFVLPLLHRLAATPGRPSPRTVRALILVPTRELATQVADSVATYGRHLDLTSTVVVGGVKPGGQIRALGRGVDVLIATPGRLLDHLGGKAVRLDRVETLVLDEADQMLDLGFLPAIKRIVAALPRDRQTALLSATMPKPIRSLAEALLSTPVEVSVAPAAKPIDRIDQTVRHVPKADKREVLVDLLSCRSIDRAIVFTRTKRGADRVSLHLQKAGLVSVAIHGNKRQGQRDRALDAFRSGQAPVLVATDVAARGIDIDGVSHVINFELPNVPEAYVHRIGRTARAGASGTAISLCDAEERGLLRDIERLIGQAIATHGDAPVAHGAAPVANPAGPVPEANGTAAPPAGTKRRSRRPRRTADKPASAAKPAARPATPARQRAPKASDRRTARPSSAQTHPGERVPALESEDGGLRRMLASLGGR